ncbi:sigma-70 family RNA polymerase sigma factor [Microaerobacter geothermalis]|uniref:sigma-70 family RNA polymerase sigma factor n=1 Tax=Microaerobacter geothermalis TaxID=674972 RepID=UPI001F3C798D|nr:sigma-70 family RNA polymerase sigma factor [Microaerobacter geothermalis]MCF6095309.1 sigma-70 family RNA polymerase sigma factor [Microaerobacter geothermalis]
MDNPRELWEKYQPLLGNCLKRFHLYGYWDDAVQVAQMALWEACLRFDSSKGYFPAYARKWINGRMLNWLSRERNWKKMHIFPREEEHEDWVDIIPDPMVQIEDHVEMGNQLNEWLEGLTQREKGCLILNVLQGYTLKEISSYYGVSIWTVAEWKKRGLYKLRKKMNNKSQKTSSKGI